MFNLFKTTKAGQAASGEHQVERVPASCRLHLEDDSSGNLARLEVLVDAELSVGRFRRSKQGGGEKLFDALFEILELLELEMDLDSAVRGNVKGFDGVLPVSDVASLDPDRLVDGPERGDLHTWKG